jgi:hypothetical protein
MEDFIIILGVSCRGGARIKRCGPTRSLEKETNKAGEKERPWKEREQY